MCVCVVIFRVCVRRWGTRRSRKITPWSSLWGTRTNTAIAIQKERSEAEFVVIIYLMKFCLILCFSFCLFFTCKQTSEAIRCLHSSTLMFEGFLNKSESPVPAFSNEFKFKKVILCKFRVLLLTCKMISAHFLCLLWVSAPLIGAKVWNICGSTFLWVVRRL